MQCRHFANGSLSISGTPCVKQQSVQSMPFRQQERVVVIACLARACKFRMDILKTRIDAGQILVRLGEWRGYTGPPRYNIRSSRKAKIKHAPENMKRDATGWSAMKEKKASERVAAHHHFHGLEVCHAIQKFVNLKIVRFYFQRPLDIYLL